MTISSDLVGDAEIGPLDEEVLDCLPASVRYPIQQDRIKVGDRRWADKR